MGIFRKLEELLFTGTTLKDYGVLSEKRTGMARSRISAVLSEKADGVRLTLRESSVAFVGMSVRYVELNRDAVAKLRAVLEDAAERMK